MSDWRNNIRKTDPYVPGEQPQEDNIIKLNTNENPYPPAPEVAGLMAEMNADRFRLYPDPDVHMLSAALADYHGVKEGQVFVGVGSDDVLAMSFLTFFNSDKPVLFPDITYSFYNVWAGLFRIPYKTPALDENYRIRIEDYIPANDREENGGIVIANPNAPTSLYEPVSGLEKIVSANPGSVVIIDEAYIDFGGESALGLVEQYDNVLVVRTFSKSRSMAGLRIGYAIGNEELINALKGVKLSYNSYTMNMPSIILGTQSVKNEDYFRDTIAKIINKRKRISEELKKMGFEVLESAANFLFISHKNTAASEIFDKLKSRGIYVRYFNKPRLDNHLRVTVGTDDEMDEFLDEIKDIVR